MKFFASLGWNIGQGWTPINIIFVVLFFVLVIALVVLTLGFRLYYKQLKKIVKIDQNIEIINRYPLDLAIQRLEKINKQNNNQFDQFYRLVRIKYLTVLEETFKTAAKYFLTGLETKEFTKMNYRSITKLTLIDQSIEKAKAEFDTLHKLLNDFFEHEYELRDVMIELKKQVDLIKTNYKSQSKTSNYHFPETVFNEYLGYIHKFINLIHNHLVTGDYQTAFDKLLKILSWTIKVNEETNSYPKIRNFLTEDLEKELDKIERDWVGDSLTLNRTRNRFKELKNQTFEESQTAFKAIKNLDFKRTKLAIENIQKLIYDFKSQLVYEEEIKTFFKFKTNDIKKTLQQIIEWVDLLSVEQSVKFKRHEKLVYDSLIKPSLRIQRMLVKTNDASESDLESMKGMFNDDLTKIEENIFLLRIIKTDSQIIEENFLEYLDLSFEIKTNLIIIGNVLKNPNQWLSEKSLQTYNEEYMQLYSQLVKDEVGNLVQFQQKFGDQGQKQSLITRLTNMKTYSYKLKSKLVYEYELYYLSVSLLPLLEFGQNESKINYMYREMVNQIDAKNYELAIEQFINNINSIYYQL